MKELIQNWLALPGLLWKSFAFLFNFFWKDRKLRNLPKALFLMCYNIIKHMWDKIGRSTKYSCTECRYFIKQSPLRVNWNNLLKTDNVLVKTIPSQTDRGSCLLNYSITSNLAACKRWSDESPSSSTEEERILSHNW